MSLSGLSSRLIFIRNQGCLYWYSIKISTVLAEGVVGNSYEYEAVSLATLLFYNMLSTDSWRLEIVVDG